MSKIEVNQIDTISGSSTLLVGPSAATKLTFSSTLIVDFNVNSPGVTLNSTMKNTPAFTAYRSGDQTGIAKNTFTKINLNAELFDTDSMFDTSTYRFTPTVAGYYYCYGKVLLGTGTASNMYVIFNYLMKNGVTAIARSQLDYRNNANGYSMSPPTMGTAYFNGTSDYLELYTLFDMGAGGTGTVTAGLDETYMGAFKLIGA